MNQPIPWRGLSFVEKLLLFLLPVVALGVLFLPFLDQAWLRPLSQLPGMRPLLDWLVNSNGSWILGGVLAVAWVGLILFERRRLNRNERLWFDSGCPACKERELIRVNRHRSDRFYGLIGVRAYRYACRNCTWRGLRIGHRHHLADDMEPAEPEIGAGAAEIAREDTVESELVAALAAPSAYPALSAVDFPAPSYATASATVSPVAEVAVSPVVAVATAASVTHSEPVTSPAENDLVDWVAPLAPPPPPTARSKADEIARLREDTGLTDEELEWLWRRVSESDEE